MHAFGKVSGKLTRLLYYTFRRIFAWKILAYPSANFISQPYCHPSSALESQRGSTSGSPHPKDENKARPWAEREKKSRFRCSGDGDDDERRGSVNWRAYLSSRPVLSRKAVTRMTPSTVVLECRPRMQCASRALYLLGRAGCSRAFLLLLLLLILLPRLILHVCVRF